MSNGEHNKRSGEQREKTPDYSPLNAQPSRRREDLLLWDQCYDRKDLPSFLDRVSLFADAVRHEAWIATFPKEETDLWDRCHGGREQRNV